MTAMLETTATTPTAELPELQGTASTTNRSEKCYRKGLPYLLAYIQEHGTAAVLRSYRSPDGFKLGEWIATQRRSYRQRRMPAARVAALERLPGWAWCAGRTPATHVSDHIWRLKAFAKLRGHVRVPATYLDQDGFHLGHWLSKVRERRHTFTPEERAAFEALPGWMWEVNKEKFGLYFTALEAYVARFGNARVPRDYVDEAGVRLGIWIQHRRARKDKLDPAENAALEALPGWQWDSRDIHFATTMEALRLHVEQYGHADVPLNYKSGDLHLGKTVWRLRRRKAGLDQATIEALEALPGWTWKKPDLNGEAFANAIARLRRYEAIHGHTDVPKCYREPDGLCLGVWIGKRRRARWTMSAERRAALEAFKDWHWWNDQTTRAFEAGLARLIEFQKLHGHINVRSDYRSPDGYALYRWIAIAALTPEQRARLDAIPGWSGIVRTRRRKMTCR